MPEVPQGWGAIDKTGNTVIPFVFDEIKHFSDTEDVFIGMKTNMKIIAIEEHYADQRIIGATAKYGDPSYMTTLGDKVRGAYNHILCTTKGFPAAIIVGGWEPLYCKHF